MRVYHRRGCQSASPAFNNTRALRRRDTWRSCASAHRDRLTTGVNKHSINVNLGESERARERQGFQTPFAAGPPIPRRPGIRSINHTCARMPLTFRLQEIYEQLHAPPQPLPVHALLPSAPASFSPFETVGTHNNDDKWQLYGGGGGGGSDGRGGGQDSNGFRWRWWFFPLSSSHTSTHVRPYPLIFFSIIIISFFVRSSLYKRITYHFRFNTFHG